VISTHVWAHNTLYFFNLLPYSILMRSPSCLFVCVCPSYHHLNAWTNLYETWQVCHSNWAHFVSPSLQSVGVSLLSLISKSLLKLILFLIARQRLSNHVPAATSNCLRRRFLCGPCLIKLSEYFFFFAELLVCVGIFSISYLNLEC
jgi:hypothetical protein